MLPLPILNHRKKYTVAIKMIAAARLCWVLATGAGIRENPVCTLTGNDRSVVPRGLFYSYLGRKVFPGNTGL